ncbi:MAG: TrkA family potassium uptake protein [Dehalococcoidia bacterium]
MRRVAFVTGLVFLIVAIGGFWYWLVEGFEPLNAFYQAVTTLTTVGFGEIEPLDASGRLFTIFYIFIGVGFLFWDLTAFVELIVLGPMAGALGLRRELGKVRRMQQHYVVCGFGRVGREVVHELTARGHSYVVIDRDPDAIADVHGGHAAAVVGNATEEDVLERAGVRRATGLIAAADSDTENTYIVLTARSMNPDLFIVARAGSESAERRMSSAGANRIVSPYKIGGRRLALSAVAPMLLDFVDHISNHQETEDDSVLAELLIAGDVSFMAGMTVSEAVIGSIHVMGIERANGKLQVGPGGAALIEQGDRLLLYGPPSAIEKLAASHARRAATP